VWGGKNSDLAEGTGKADGISGTRSATSASDRLVQTLAALRKLQDCCGSAAEVAGTRLSGGRKGAEKFAEAALGEGFQI